MTLHCIKNLSHQAGSWKIMFWPNPSLFVDDRPNSGPTQDSWASKFTQHSGPDKVAPIKHLACFYHVQIEWFKYGTPGPRNHLTVKGHISEKIYNMRVHPGFSMAFKYNYMGVLACLCTIIMLAGKQASQPFEGMMTSSLIQLLRFREAQISACLEGHVYTEY